MAQFHAETPLCRRYLLAILFTVSPASAYASNGRPQETIPATRHTGPAASRSGQNAAETISVIAAKHESHGSETVLSAAELKKFVPGTNPLAVLNQTPGVLFTSADPLGQDAFASQLYVRGFFQNQIGFTLDGIPLGELTYRNYNGLAINQAIISDNIGRMTISQGAGAIEVPSTNDLGGAIQFFSQDPSDLRKAAVSQTFGSNAAYRTFVRLDSGKINATGTKLYVSYARNDSDKWKGNGPLFDQKVNAKLVQPVGDSSRVSVFFDWDDLEYLSYQNLSLNYLSTLGPRLDNFYPDYTAAYLAAKGIYQNGQQLTNDPKDAMYYDSSAMSQDVLSGLNGDFKLADGLDLNTVVYSHWNSQFGGYTSPFASSPSGAPLRYQEHQGSIRRYGATADVTYEIGRNSLNSGIWYENYRYIMDYNAYGEPLLGQGDPVDPLGAFNDPLVQLWGTTFNTNTFQFHIKDNFRLLPHLSLQAGFKSLVVTTHGGATSDDVAYTHQAQLASGSLTTSSAFLPHFAANWQFLRSNELYFDISKNIRAYAQGGYQMGQAWGVTNQATFDQLKQTITPETDWAYELGYRYTNRLLTGSLSLYRVDFSNRLQSLASASIINPVSTLVNVGSVTLDGIDAAATLRPLRGLSIYNSISYNKSTYGGSIVTKGVTYDLSGKNVVNFPTFMYRAGIDYALGGWNFHVDTDYVGKRYISYLNDTSVPDYWVSNLGIKYTFGSRSIFHNITAEFNIYNLFNESYISTMGEEGNPFKGDYQTLLIGAPRQFFGTIRAEF